MANHEGKRSSRAQRFAAFCVASTVMAGCTGMTQTTTSVRSLPGATSPYVHLTRAGVTPVAGTFHQEGHAIVGQLAFTSDCTLESKQLVRRQETKDTHPNRGTGTALAVLGGLVAIVGVAAIAASSDANDTVSCGEGRAGDRCESESSALMEGGVTALLSGLTLGISGGYFLAQKPQLETKELPPETHTTLVSHDVSCGSTRALEGLSVALELPKIGSWSGRAATDGSVRIDVSENIQLPEGVAVPIVVDAVPANLVSVVSPGAAIGEVSFVRAAVAPKKSTRPKEVRDPLATRW